jgi:hypothetical protein
MNPRAVLVLLLVGLLSTLPAVAGQPSGLAANLVTDRGDADGVAPAPPSLCFLRSFEWVEAVGPRELGPGESLRLHLAIVPFQSGTTYLDLDMIDGQTFFGIEFKDGLVNGLPYRRADWNDVVVDLWPATLDYLLTVNGVQAGPFPYDEFCPVLGGCYSVQAMRIHGFSNETGAAAWVDSIVVSAESSSGPEVLRAITFDDCAERPYVVGGVILIVEPPHPLFRPGRCRNR